MKKTLRNKSLGEQSLDSEMRDSLESVVESFHKSRILVWGDVFVDHYVWGKVSRISPEAPVVVVNVESEDRRLGGAGNVAKNLVTLGAKVAICTVLGDDEAGRLTRDMLEAEGIDVSGILLDKARSTIVKSRVIAHSQQVVR